MSEAAKLCELKQAWDHTRGALRDFVAQRDDEQEQRFDAVRDEINEKYRDAIARLRSEAVRAERAYQDAIVEAAKDKLKDYPAGIVVEWTQWRDNWQRRPDLYKPTGRRGKYEIRTRETLFAANRNHGRPSIGEVFIRLIKKDGTPGTGFVESRKSGDWLPEGETPKDAEAALAEVKGEAQ